MERMRIEVMMRVAGAAVVLAGAALGAGGLAAFALTWKWHCLAIGCMGAAVAREWARGMKNRE